MNSQELIAQVAEMSSNNWKNSDLFLESEKMFEEIAEHLQICESCANEFDAQEYPETSLIDFEHYFNSSASGSQLSSWICEKPRKADGTYQKIITEERKYRYISNAEWDMVKRSRKIGNCKNCDYECNADDFEQHLIVSHPYIIHNLNKDNINDDYHRKQFFRGKGKEY